MADEITVVIVFYHGLDDLRRCLLALDRQSHQPVKVIIVDNSPGGLCGEIACSDKVVILRSGTNLGFAAGNNWAIREADTELVFTLNADAFPRDNCLEQLVKAAGNHPECGAFGCVQLQAEDERFLDGLGDFYDLRGLMWRRGYGCLISKFQIVDGDISSPCGAAALYRKSVFDAVGGFDEDFFCYCEDVDLGLRIWSQGWTCRLVSSAVVVHKGSGSTEKQSDFALYHGLRNLVWVFIKNMPGILFYVLLPLHLIVNFRIHTSLSKKGRGLVALQARSDAIARFKHFWKKRQKIASSRRIAVWNAFRFLDFSLLPGSWRRKMMKSVIKVKNKLPRYRVKSGR